MSQSERRRLPSSWLIYVCPGCNGLMGEQTQTHLGDCEYRHTMFVPRAVWVRPDVPPVPPLARLDAEADLRNHIRKLKQGG